MPAGRRFRVATWNVGTLSEKEEEVADELAKRRVDVCCLQEVHRQKMAAMMLGREAKRYKLFWQGEEEGWGSCWPRSG